MKTNEFIRRVNELEVVKEVKVDSGFIRIYDSFHFLIAKVSTNNIHQFNTMTVKFKGLTHKTKVKMIDLLTEYATTPVEERVEEKKYYLKLPGIGTVVDYINFAKNRGYYFISTKDDSDAIQSTFAQSEIDKFPDDVKKLISVAEWIEVVEG